MVLGCGYDAVLSNDLSDVMNRTTSSLGSSANGLQIMSRGFWICLVGLLATAPHLAAQDDAQAARPAAGVVSTDTNWPSFHGPGACGFATGHKTPARWDVQKGTNIAWKTRLPGLSHGSPIVWGDRIYLVNAVRDGEGKAPLKVGRYGSIQPVANDTVHTLQVLCLDKRSGKVLWTKTAWKGIPKIARHPKGSHAASTPATDGQHVAAFFGSEGLYVYDVAGKLLWKKDLGVLDSGFFRVKSAQWGFASSPVIHAGRVFVQCDIQDQSFLAAFDVKSGREIWRTDREEVPTWGTPTIHAVGDRPQVIVNGWKHIGGYHLDTGKELWKVVGGGDIPVPTPVVAGGMVYITNAHGRAAPILAISTAAEGEFSMDADESDHMVWSVTRGGNYMQTPVVVGGLLYSCRDNGVLTCRDAKTGEEFYKKRLGPGRTGFTPSGVSADGKLYFPSEEGEVYVVKCGREFDEIGMNELGEITMASPAISGGMLLFRTRGHLIAVAERP